MTGSCGEHHQHVVAADGERLGGAETFADGPCTAHHQYSRTRWSTFQGTRTKHVHHYHIISHKLFFIYCVTQSLASNSVTIIYILFYLFLFLCFIIPMNKYICCILAPASATSEYDAKGTLSFWSHYFCQMLQDTNRLLSCCFMLLDQSCVLCLLKMDCRCSSNWFQLSF